MSRIIILRRACEKPHKIREFEPTHVGCYVMVASGVSRIILFCRAFDKLRTIREFEPTHVGCYVMVDELDAALRQWGRLNKKILGEALGSMFLFKWIRA